MEQVAERTRKKDAKKKRLETFEYKDLAYEQDGTIVVRPNGIKFSEVINNNGTVDELYEKLDLYIESEFGNLKLVENGMATDYSEEFATKILSSDYVKTNIEMKIADAKATAWGCDLTYDYGKINADYRS